MDIRTKLVFGFVAVTVGSMLAFGAFMYMTVNRLVNQATIDQLDGLAESSAGAIGSIADGWQERVVLIASRTQLRITLRDFNQTGDPAAAGRIQRILEDATEARSVARITVYDRGGEPVASAGTVSDSALAELSPRSTSASVDRVLFLGARFTELGYPRVEYSRGLTLDGERVGYLHVLLNARRIVELTRDTLGLGESGEVMVFARDGGELRTLHPVRHSDQDGQPFGWIRVDENDDAGPAVRALAGEDGVHTEGLIDYRGEPVWAATRFLPQTGWGLVVKFDAEEKRTGVAEFSERMVSVALSLAGLGILVAVVLGFRFAGPIHELAATSNQIRQGDLTARAPVKREDEIGLLAITFNDMADALEKQVAELHEFHKFFDVSLDMLCIAGTDGYFKRTNPAFTETLGWTSEQLLERPFFDLIHPDDLEPTQHEIEKLSQGIPTISFVNRFRCADGSWKQLRWNSYPDPETGLLYAIAREVGAPGAG